MEERSYRAGFHQLEHPDPAAGVGGDVSAETGGRSGPACVTFCGNRRDAAVREPLAKGLFNTLVDATSEGALDRGALLAKFRELAGRYPEDAAVREWLAKGLLVPLLEVDQEGSRWDSLLLELGQLVAEAELRWKMREALDQMEASESRPVVLKRLAKIRHQLGLD